MQVLHGPKTLQSQLWTACCKEWLQTSLLLCLWFDQHLWCLRRWLPTICRCVYMCERVCVRCAVSVRVCVCVSMMMGECYSFCPSMSTCETQTLNSDQTCVSFLSLSRPLNCWPASCPCTSTHTQRQQQQTVITQVILLLRAEEEQVQTKQQTMHLQTTAKQEHRVKAATKQGLCSSCCWQHPLGCSH